MTDPELIRRAEAAGVVPRYLDSRQQWVEVSGDTLAAILDALGEPGGPGGPGEPGESGKPGGPGGRSERDRRAPDDDGGRAAAPRPPVPRGRSWGFTVQLYSVRSRRSWGHGDLRDLADLAAWSARDLGAGFVLINPLHAAEPLPPVSPSPYLPMTRRYVSPLYLRIEDIPEYAELSFPERTRLSLLGQPLRAASVTPALIDREAVWT